MRSMRVRAFLLALALSLIAVLGVAPLAIGATEDAAPEEPATVVEDVAATEEPAVVEDAPASEEQVVVEEEPVTEDVEAPAPAAAPDEQEAGDSDEAAMDEQGSPTPTVSLEGYVQDVGWTKNSSGSNQVGTTGQSRRIEGIKIKLSGEGIPSGSIEYRAHVQGIGWQGWRKDGALAGTNGAGKRVEAIQIRLTGELANQYDVYYAVHAQRIGWTQWAKNGESCGTAGRSFRVEAVRVTLVPKGDPAPAPISGAYVGAYLPSAAVKVSAHSQRMGWMDYVKEGAVAGTSGMSLRMEAFKAVVEMEDGYTGGITYTVKNKDSERVTASDGGVGGITGSSLPAYYFNMKLTGDVATYYDVYYRAHVSNVGWLGWAKNGAWAGSNTGVRIEAIQVVLVAKGTAGPGSGDCAIKAPYFSNATVTYSAYVQGQGWGPDVQNGANAGSTGSSLRLESLKASVSGSSVPSGSIQYSLHIQGTGWTGWSSNGAACGTGGSGKRVEGIRIRLTGDMARTYDVYYRVHSQSVGWLGWAKNGEDAGTSGGSKRAEAIQIRLVRKGGAAPGSTANHFMNLSNYDAAMSARAQGYSSPTGWLVLVDTSRHRVGIFRGSRNNWQQVQFWQCTNGQIDGHETPKGVYSIGSKGYSFGESHGYSCYYWTQFYGEYLFHSIKYNAGTLVVQDGTMGAYGSAGCVRLLIQNAKWLQDNVPSGSTVVVY